MEKKMLKKIEGFTLIELLIVVAIIAILAAIAVPNFIEAQTRSKISRSKADMRTFGTAIEAYAVDNNAYFPPDQTDQMNTGAYNGDSQSYVPGIWWLYIQWGALTGTPYEETECLGAYLTTPIAYLATIMTNPLNATEADGVQDWGSPVKAASVMYGSRYGKAPVECDVDDGLGNHIHQYPDCGYFMWGAGPSGIFISTNNQNYGVDSNPNEDWILGTVPYDPSNGTMSLGELIYAGKTGLVN